MMRALILAGKKDPIIRVFTADLVQSAGTGNSKNRLGEIEAVFLFVRDDVRYVWDVEGVETLQTPRYTLEHRHGDCDDKTTLAGAMLASIGHKVRVCPAGPGRGLFHHVYLEALLYTRKGPKWLALDCTENHPLGWAPPHAQKMIFHCK